MSFVLTLGSTSFVLILGSTGFALTLGSTSFVLTLNSTSFVLTLGSTGFVLVLQTHVLSDMTFWLVVFGVWWQNSCSGTNTFVLFYCCFFKYYFSFFFFRIRKSILWILTDIMTIAGAGNHLIYTLFMLFTLRPILGGVY